MVEGAIFCSEVCVHQILPQQDKIGPEQCGKRRFSPVRSTDAQLCSNVFICTPLSYVFHLIQCDTGEEDLNVLNFTWKLTQHGTEYGDEDESHDSKKVGRSARKMRKVPYEIQRDSKKRTKDFHELTGVLKQIIYAQSSSKGNSSNGNDSTVALVLNLHASLEKNRI